MRPIDADALKKTIDSEIFRHDTIDHVFQIIDDAPSIDIVRCAECKHRHQCRKAVEHITHESTSVTIGYKSVEWCSYGEREGE